MSNIIEIEAAIEKLPPVQVDELAEWLEAFRQRRATPRSVEDWLDDSRGAAMRGVRTQEVMELTRSGQ